MDKAKLNIMDGSEPSTGTRIFLNFKFHFVIIMLISVQYYGYLSEK